MSCFAGFPPAPPDPILHLNTLYREDPNPKKVSLGVGAYRDENGKPWILPSVRMAEAVISKDLDKYNKEYPPVPGFPDYLQACQNLMFGEGSPVLQEKRVASCQSLSGTGSLHIGFDFLHEWMPNAQIYVPSCTWPNHLQIIEKIYGRDHKPHTYQYLAANGDLVIDFEKCLADIRGAPEGSVFLFHAVAHNPSGIDFTNEQWTEIRKVMKEKHHVGFFDSAYQGFATGSFENDAFAVRTFVADGIDCLVSQSFAKNFGLYGERIGCIHVVHKGVGSPDENAKLSASIQSGLANRVRRTWSMSPIHGAYIVKTIANDKAMLAQFYEDVKTMANRIKKMRQMLHDELVRINCPGIGPNGTWSHILTAVGMFTFTGLTPEQVDYLRDHWSVYLVRNGGRMSMCGLTEKNVAYVAEAIKDAIEKCPKK